MILSKEVVRKLSLLYLINEFERGVWGNFKFQKTLYYSLKDSDVKPFPFRRTGSGQFSQEAWNVLDELHEAGMIEDKSNNSRSRNWVISSGTNINDYSETFESLFGNLARNIRKSVKAYCRKTWDELKEIAHSDPALINTEMYDLIFDENVPDKIEVTMNPDDCFDLEMSFNRGFVSAVSHLVSGVDSGEISLEQWQVEPGL